MTNISIPKPKTNASSRGVGDEQAPRKSNGKRSSSTNTKLARGKGNKNTTVSRSKKNSEVDVEKKTTKNPENEKVAKVKEEFDVGSVLPEGYVPEVYKFGKNEGYVYLPRHIFDWLGNHKHDWFKMLDEFPFYMDIDIIRSLLYYIIQDGFVYIQENRNHKFYKVRISEE